LSARPGKIRFSEYTQNIPQNIPVAVQQATQRFVDARALRVAEQPGWETLRQAASDIRQHTLDYMDHYLELFASQVIAAGGQVHWAVDAEEANKIVLQIARQNKVKNIVKSKSMATEETGLNHALEEHGFRIVETDLGEFIIQLAGLGPSHIIVPAVHMTKEEIASLFTEKLGVEAPAEPLQLTAIARQKLRQEFLQADMAITGANYLVAETGTLVMVTNEGNGRMCTTLPDIHVAVAGIDKIVPDLQSLSVLLKVLARSATGQKLSTYTQFITGAQNKLHGNGVKQFHIVLLDNGRSQILEDPVGRDVLKCIRCGSCLNVCPVYKHVGGYAYGWFISGPIGAIFTPQILGTQAASELPYASSLCGACVDVCPVKIPITKILLHLRRRTAEGDSFSPANVPSLIRSGAKASRFLLSATRVYEFGTWLLAWITAPLQRNGWIMKLPPPLNRWTQVRPLPAFRGKFRSWWKKRHARSDQHSSPYQSK
jgi:L-lactate dehydrogenase complex protein LldF